MSWNLQYKNLKNISVLVLAAGKGSRFNNYSDKPKHLLPINDNPMYKHAISHLNIVNRYSVHGVFQKEFTPNTCDIIRHTIKGYTEGSASTAYEVIKHMRHQAWLIMDCDAVIKTNPLILENSGIVVERKKTIDPRASYSKIVDGKIVATAEKQVISQNRNVGMYFWQSGYLFCECYEYAQKHELKVNNEYYISPLYNIAINEMQEIVNPLWANEFYPIGTPNDYENYLNHVQDSSISNR